MFSKEAEGYFGDRWNGLLVVQDIEQETAGVEEQGDSEINILQASELETDLETVLEEII